MVSFDMLVNYIICDTTVILFEFIASLKWL